jgi:hypothetical protein
MKGESLSECAKTAGNSGQDLREFCAIGLSP